VSRVVAALVVIFAIARCSDAPRPGSIAPSGLPEPDPKNAVTVEVRAATTDYHGLSGQMKFEVTVTNTSAEPIVACAEDWSKQTGILYLRIFNEAGRELLPTDGLHADFNVEEETTLVLLRPGEHISGPVDLLIRGAKYPLEPGTYRIVAAYYCPFDGVRRLNGITATIAGSPQVSHAIDIKVSQ
jgi:hypothetical protein